MNTPQPVFIDTALLQLALEFRAPAPDSGALSAVWGAPSDDSCRRSDRAHIDGPAANQS